jgi:aminoglycoside/choline kinase family phosphotransferase
MTPTAPPSDPRADEARAFALEALGIDDADFAPASADASFRRYFRVRRGDQSWIVMDAPPATEDCRPFLSVADLMIEAGLNAPRIIGRDLERGYLLLSDLGRQTYLHVINADNADALFADALSALIAWQRLSTPGLLPPYDAALLRRELDLFPDWYVARHLDRSFIPAQAAVWNDIVQRLIDAALDQSTVFVHRDYMPRNLMVSTPNPGVLDFQDAVYGPISYDVVSLFKDAFVSWPQQRVETWARRYWDMAQAVALPVPADFATFFRDFEWMGMQHHLKVLGIFARIRYRDGKPHYLTDAPRFVTYVRDVAARYDALRPILGLFDELGLS